MQIALILCYPLLVHFSVATNIPHLRVVALAVLAAGLFYRGLKNKSRLAWLVFTLVLAACAIAGYLDLAGYALYMPPVMIPALMFAVFATTLAPGKTPLVTAIGERARGPLSPVMRRYTRGVTWLWSVLFALMAIWSAALPWVAPPEIWSLFTNLLNYLVTGALFLFEFLYRRYRFPEHNHPSFRQYIKIVINANAGH